MATPDMNKMAAAAEAENLDEMKEYGITRVPVDYFHYRDFRYTTLRDAIAQAKRERGRD